MKCKRERLAQRRKMAGYSQERLAEVLRIERSTVARWERAETQPQPWLRPRLAKALGISRDVLAELLTDVVVDRQDDDDRLDRVLAQPALADIEAVRQLRNRVGHVAAAYETAPSASLLADAGQCHATAEFLLTQVRDESVRAELHAAASASATLMSQLVWDASHRRDYHTTVAYCDIAIEHAHEHGDTIAAANAELRKGFAAMYGQADVRDPKAGLISAQLAAEQSRSVSNALGGLSLLHVGEAYAMLGEYRRCEQALSQAEDCFNQIAVDDCGAEFFSPTQLGRLAGSCYLFLGHPERAEPILKQTAEALHARPKTRSLVLGNLALAHLRQRRLDAATATLHEAIDLLEDSRGGGGLTVVFSAGRELYPWRAEPAVHDVYDRLLALVARA
ncbi:MAG: helix-turn-helix transcriptional regulator [Pseudonocardiaceae bacterium]